MSVPAVATLAGGGRERAPAAAMPRNRRVVAAAAWHRERRPRVRVGSRKEAQEPAAMSASLRWMATGEEAVGRQRTATDDYGYYNRVL